MTLGDNMEYIQQNKVGLPGFGFFPPLIIELLKNLTQVRIVGRMLRRRIVKIPVSPASVYKTEAIDCTTSRLFDLPRCWVSKNHLPGHIERKYSPLYHSLLLNQLSQPWSCWISPVWEGNGSSVWRYKGVTFSEKFNKSQFQSRLDVSGYNLNLTIQQDTYDRLMVSPTQLFISFSVKTSLNWQSEQK